MGIGNVAKRTIKNSGHMVVRVAPIKVFTPIYIRHTGCAASSQKSRYQLLKKNYLPGLLAAATLTLLTLTVTSPPALAQDSGQMGQQQRGEGVVNDDERDNNSNWGWLGLAGLAGLAGLRRQPTTTTTVVRDDKEGARAY